MKNLSSCSLTLFISFLLLFSSITQAQNWFPVGSGLDNNNNKIKALIEFNGKIIAGGDFFTIGGGNIVYRIAQWDGNTWQAMGAGFDNEVRALAVFNNELYAAGTFSSSSDQNTALDARIAKWNGTVWEPVAGADINNTGINDMLVWNNKLYITNNKWNGPTIKPVVTYYDGNTWTDLPGYFKGPENYCYLNKLDTFQNQLVVGGVFDSVANLQSQRIAIWNNTNWVGLGLPVRGRQVFSNGITGLKGTCKSIIEYHGKLYAGGLFADYIQGNDTINPNLVSFDGSNWTAHPWDINTGNSINDMLIHNDSLILAADGAFYNPNMFLTGGCIVFDTASTFPFIGTNFTNPNSPGLEVSACIRFNDKVHVGGKFSHAGTNQVNGIARMGAGNTLGENIISANKNFNVAPNPFNDHIQINTNKGEHLSSFNLTDAIGKTIKVIVMNENNVTVQCQDLLPGMYFLINSDSPDKSIKLVKNR
ncbi:MAG: T9SS type A sorting domain-containing protein [Bacteroidota bacterium]|jgi:hypothetical protein